MAGEFARCSEGIMRLFFVGCLSNLWRSCNVPQWSYKSSVRVLMNGSRRGLKECPKNPNRKIIFEAVCGKEFCTNARMLGGRKSSLFISKSHSLLSFGSWVNLKVQTLDFEENSSEISRIFELTNSQAISFISDNFPKIFPTALQLRRLKHKFYQTSISSILPPVRLKLRNMLILYF